MKRYALSILLERLDKPKSERILLHRSLFKADHDFHAIDVANELGLITKRCRRLFTKSLHEWFAQKNQKPDTDDNDLDF
jgi:hypothetical protein